MDWATAQLNRIQQQLSTLNASQRMLAAALVAIMMMTVVWWSRYAGTSEFVSVFNHAVRAEDLPKMQSTLSGASIESKIVGDQLMVPSERRAEALGAVISDDSAPADLNATDELFKLIGVWDSNAKMQLAVDKTLENKLSRAIPRYIPGVSDATVMLNLVKDHAIGSASHSTASVFINTQHRGELNPHKIAAAIANTVSYAANLKPSDVTIAIDGRSQPHIDSDDDFSSSDFDEIARKEKDWSYNAGKLLPPDAVVVVKADMNRSNVQEQTEQYDKKTSFTLETKSETESQETQQGSKAQNEPGAVPNTGGDLSQTVSHGDGNSMTSEKSKSESQALPSKINKTTVTRGGNVICVSAAARIPRDDFVRAYMKLNKVSVVDEAALAPYIAQKKAGFVSQICNSLGISPDKVDIGVNDDDLAPVAVEASIAPTGTLATIMSSHSKEIALGILAAASLFMVSTIVRKSVPTPLTPPPEMSNEPQTLGGMQELAGIVSASGETLDGVEVDEASLRHKQVVDQVSTMVKEDPDAAANLVKRWMTHA